MKKFLIILIIISSTTKALWQKTITPETFEIQVDKQNKLIIYAKNTNLTILQSNTNLISTKFKKNNSKSKINIKSDQSEIIIEQAGSAKNISLDIALPENFNIEIRSKKSNINILKAKNQVNIKNKTGKIYLHYQEFNESSKINVNNKKGEIKIDIPRTTKADIKLNTENGSICSDCAITIYRNNLILDKNYWNNLKKSITGTLNGGGNSINAQTKNGNIIFCGYSDQENLEN